jgi:uncharacterized protein YutE (UPF0331/DUF86 family)
MIQNDVVQSKLRFLQEYLQDLAEYRSITLSAYTAGKKDQRFVERTLHLACECCIDIAAHLVSRKSFRPPKDNKDLFNILHENGIISDTVRSAMIKMTQFRNIVVHDYARIDPEIVIGILNRDMDDLKRFAGEVIGQVTST